MKKTVAFETAFMEFVNKHHLFDKQDKILAAVSGGVDSVVLCELLSRNGFHFEIAHVNFKLRGKDADEDEALVLRLAEVYHIKAHVTAFSTENYAKQHKISIEMAARELRYNWFDELQETYNFDKIALAHHLGDHLETILLNLTKGAAFRGLHGILPLNRKLVRPLLFATKRQILDYAKKMKLEYREDSTNSDVHFQRNLIRKKVVPLLKKINPSVEKTIFQNAQLINDYEAIIDREFNRMRKKIIHSVEKAIFIDCKSLVKYPSSNLFLYEELNPFGFSKDQISAVLKAANASPGIKFESVSHVIFKDRDFFIVKEKTDTTKEVYLIDKNKGSIVTNMGTFSYKIQSTLPMEDDLKNPDHAYLEFEKLTFPLVMRTWRKGDYFFPFGLKGRKKISDFLNDKKISVDKKTDYLVLSSGEDIVWIPPFTIDQRYAVNIRSEKILSVALTKGKLE